MKYLSLAGPLAVWLALAVPYLCHHGLVTAWSAHGHVHHSAATDGDTAFTADAGMDDGDLQTTLCQHESSQENALMAYAAVDSDAADAGTSVARDHLNGTLVRDGPLTPSGVPLTPLERPPSHTG